MKSQEYDVMNNRCDDVMNNRCVKERFIKYDYIIFD